MTLRGRIERLERTERRLAGEWCECAAKSRVYVDGVTPGEPPTHGATCPACGLPFFVVTFDMAGVD